MNEEFILLWENNNGNKDLQNSLIITNPLVDAKYAVPFLDGIVTIVVAISARIILRTIKTIIFAEKTKRRDASLMRFKENVSFTFPVSTNPFLNPVWAVYIQRYPTWIRIFDTKLIS